MNESHLPKQSPESKRPKLSDSMKLKLGAVVLGAICIAPNAGDIVDSVNEVRHFNLNIDPAVFGDVPAN